MVPCFTFRSLKYPNLDFGEDRSVSYMLRNYLNLYVSTNRLFYMLLCFSVCCYVCYSVSNSVPISVSYSVFAFSLLLWFLFSLLVCFLLGLVPGPVFCSPICSFLRNNFFVTVGPAMGQKTHAVTTACHIQTSTISMRGCKKTDFLHQSLEISLALSTGC